MYKQPLIVLCQLYNILVGVSVSHVIKMTWERLPRLQSLKLNELILKVCGRDEYLDKFVYVYVNQLCNDFILLP